jgi:hypothetical protein
VKLGFVPLWRGWICETRQLLTVGWRFCRRRRRIELFWLSWLNNKWRRSLIVSRPCRVRCRLFEWRQVPMHVLIVCHNTPVGEFDVVFRLFRVLYRVEPVRRHFY